jgi:hypothetical protein
VGFFEHPDSRGRPAPAAGCKQAPSVGIVHDAEPDSCAIRRLANPGTVTIKASTAMDSLHRIF